MEEEDCESVTEAKTMSMKKKINVLEAMAKYNIKKQQEQEEKMKNTPKKQDSSFMTAEPNKQIKLTKQEKKEARKESDLGITEYFLKGEGFSAILKQRFSDFHVHEISMDGTVVHLTDQSIPEYLETTTTTEEQKAELLTLLTTDQWNSLEDMMKSEDPKTVEIDVTDKNKEERQDIHKALRIKFEGITSNSENVANKTVMKIFKLGQSNRRERKPVRTTNRYTQFVMYKENISTMDAINTIARRNR